MHYAPHGPIDLQTVDVDVLALLAVQVLRAAPGARVRARELLESWRPYKVRPASNDPVGHRFETGTLPHELLAGFVAAVEYVQWAGWKFILEHEHALGAAVPRRAARRRGRCTAPPTMDGRVSTFAITHAERGAATRSRSASPRPASRSGTGNYYAVEVMKRLGLTDGAVRVGIVHYNTEDEVDGLLAELRAL